MSVLAYARSFPGGRRLISISARQPRRRLPSRCAQSSVNHLRDPHWRGGAYTDAQPPATGMRIARKLGMMTYRSAHEWRAFWSPAATPPTKPGSVRSR